MFDIKIEKKMNPYLYFHSEIYKTYKCSKYNLESLTHTHLTVISVYVMYYRLNEVKIVPAIIPLNKQANHT